jgi:hypothetical protein
VAFHVKTSGEKEPFSSFQLLLKKDIIFLSHVNFCIFV